MRDGGEVDDAELNNATETCDQCFYSTPEYEDLASFSPLFTFCMDWIRRQEIKLERHDLTHREEEAILVVHSAIEAGRAKRLEKGREHGKSSKSPD